MDKMQNVEPRVQTVLEEINSGFSAELAQLEHITHEIMSLINGLHSTGTYYNIYSHPAEMAPQEPVAESEIRTDMLHNRLAQLSRLRGILEKGLDDLRIVV